MPIISNDETRVGNALAEAEAIFWEYIADAFPEATSGDLSPACAIALSTTMRAALVEWLEFNADSPPQVATVMLHRIEYYYRDFNAMDLTDGDEEHIAYCISEGISEGDLCATNVNDGSDIYGYWKINNSVI